MKCGNKTWKCGAIVGLFVCTVTNMAFAEGIGGVWDITVKNRVWDVRLNVEGIEGVGKVGDVNVLALVNDKDNTNNAANLGLFNGTGRVGFGFNRVNRGIGVVDGEFVFKFWRWKAGVFVGANMAFLTEDLAFGGDWKKVGWMDTRFMARTLDTGRFRTLNDKAAIFGGGIRIGINF